MEAPASATTPKLAWKWILEKLVDLPDFGVAFIIEVITSHVTDIEEPHCRPLLERVALRYLEEMVVTNQVDSDAIPLLKALTGQDLGTPGTTIGSSVQQRFNKELVLRVQTEVVLSVLRKDVDEEEKDWALYELELERVFGEAEEDNRLLDRKRELSALLKSKNQTKVTVAAYFEKYSLNKLRNDLYSFIDEKKVSFKTMFLNQLSRDFLDANGKPFSEELGDVEKSTKVEANGKQDHVGQNPKVNATRDQHIVLGTPTVSGKKRLRRKLLPTQDDIDDEEAEEDSAGMKKPRQVPSTSIFNPLKTTLLRQGVSELVVPAFGSPQSGCFPVKQAVESCKQLSLLNRGEKPLSGARNLGLEVMKSCSLAAHERVSIEGTKISPREPSRTNKYVVISDVESDAKTQVVKRLSTDDEDSLTKKGDGDNHNKKGAQSSSENGHPQNIVETEVERKETIIVQSERKILVDRKKGSPEAKASHQEDNEKFVTTKNEFIPLDNSQDTYEVDFLELGSDGHEEVCHTCGKHGKLLCCDGCPISMHFDCIEGLGLRLPKGEEDWYCPVCLSLKAAQEAAEAEKAAVEAKEKLKAFKMESKKRQSSPEGDELPHSGGQGAFKQRRLRIRSLQSGENDRALKPEQQSDEEPKLEGQQDSDPPKASLLPTVLRNGLRQLKQSGEQDKSDHLSLPEDKSPSNRVASLEQGVDGKKVSDAGRAVRVNEHLMKNASPKSLVKRSIPDGSAKPVSRNEDVRTPHKTQHSHNVSRGDPFAASTSGQTKRESERFARFSKKKGPEVVDSGEESAEQAGTAGVPEPGSAAAGGRREIERDKEDENLDEDRGKKPEHRNQGALFSGRQKLPGLRRRHLPWTRREEHALKEGVKRFSHNGSWGFQWKRILEFGQGRFDPSRTYVDLKDKWRNLVKGVS